MAFWWGVGRQKFFGPECVNLAQRWRTLQEPKQVSVRVKLVFLCGFYQAIDHRAGLSACRCIGKEPVLPAHNKRLYTALGTVVAQLQSPIFQISYQIRPLLQQVMQRLSKSRFRRRFRGCLLCPRQQSVQNRFLLLQALSISFFRCQSGERLLQLEQPSAIALTGCCQRIFSVLFGQDL